MLRPSLSASGIERAESQNLRLSNADPHRLPVPLFIELRNQIFGDVLTDVLSDFSVWR